MLTGLILRACKKRYELAPFIYSLALVFLAYTGFIISLWPNVIPPSISIWDAAAPESSQLFALIGALILIPMFIQVYHIGCLETKYVLVMRGIIKNERDIYEKRQ